MSCSFLAVHGVEDLAPASGTVRTRHGLPCCGGRGARNLSRRVPYITRLFEHGFKEWEFEYIFYTRYSPFRMGRIISSFRIFVVKQKGLLKLLVKIK